MQLSFWQDWLGWIRLSWLYNTGFCCATKAERGKVGFRTWVEKEGGRTKKRSNVDEGIKGCWDEKGSVE